MFVKVPKSKCQTVRDWLRQERLLGKGQMTDQTEVEVVSIPVLVEPSRRDLFLGLLIAKVGLGEHEVVLVDRPGHGTKVKLVDKGGAVYRAMKQACQEVIHILVSHNTAGI